MSFPNTLAARSKGDHRPSPGHPAKPGNISDWISPYIRAANIKKGSCHLFRHAMATAMLDRGAELRFIQEMLGHEQISATQVYTHVSLQKLRDVYGATHPSPNLKRRAPVRRRPSAKKPQKWAENARRGYRPKSFKKPLRYAR